MGSFGERLQRERESRSITLEDISESTKISSHALRALEEERFDQLPGGIFNKGFVRAYARCVGIDEDQAVADFVAASGGDKEQPLPDPPVPRSVALGPRPQSKSNWRAFLLLALLLVSSVFTSWKLRPSAFHQVLTALAGRLSPKTTSAPDQPTIAPPTAIDPAGAPPQTPVAEPVKQAENPPPSKTGPPPQQTKTGFARDPGSGGAPAAEKKPSAKSKPAAVTASVPTTALPNAPEVPAVPAAEVPASSFTVQVRANEEAWVQITVDGKLLSAGVLAPATEKRVRAAKEVVIKTENAAGVDVLLDGRPMGPLGEEHAVTTVTLTAAGIQH